MNNMILIPFIWMRRSLKTFGNQYIYFEKTDCTYWTEIQIEGLL